MVWSNKKFGLKISNKIQLISPVMSSDQPLCLEFWHYVTYPATLMVKLRRDNTESVIWRPASAAQNVPWTKASVDIDSQTNFQVIMSDNYFMILS